MSSLQKCFLPLARSSFVEKALDQRLKAKHAKECLIYCFINVMLLVVLIYDISTKCLFVHSNWYTVEYIIIVINALSAVGCFLKYIMYVFSRRSVKGSKEKRELLDYDENDKTFLVDQPKEAINQNSWDASANSGYILNWHSSFNDPNHIASPKYKFTRITPPSIHSSSNSQQQHHTPYNWGTPIRHYSIHTPTGLSRNSFGSPYEKCKRDNLILDDDSLQRLLLMVSLEEHSAVDSVDYSQMIKSKYMNTLWNYWNAATNLLRTSIYQLAPSTSPSTQRHQKPEEGLKVTGRNSEVIARISADKLTKFVSNLRVWLAKTILHRLAKEIETIDESFQKRGFIDMRIGRVGIERLKKTSENQLFVYQCMPALPLIVPFLDVSNNQEYLVQRIKDLAKGPCISDYHWNSGASYHGLKWDEHLLTDSAIIFHLFCTYIDSQLMPLPQGCSSRPFYSRYVIEMAEKHLGKDTLASVKNKASCAILCTNPLKPKFNFISDGVVHTSCQDRNNLFYVIIQFLLHMKTQYGSCLEGVNLGASGINIMCVVED